MAEENLIKPWMYRYPGEYSALLLGFIFLVAFGLFVNFIEFYLLVGLLILGLVYVLAEQSRQLGNSIMVHKNQFPEIYEIFYLYAKTLGINRASLYIRQDPFLNAFCLGVHKCTVVLSSALVEQLTQEELAFVIAHELGHYQAGHTKLAWGLSPVGEGNIISKLFFGLWQRRCEYTSDRCGLALTKDIDSSISALIKLAIGKKLFQSLDIGRW